MGADNCERPAVAHTLAHSITPTCRRSRGYASWSGHDVGAGLRRARLVLGVRADGEQGDVVGGSCLWEQRGHDPVAEVLEAEAGAVGEQVSQARQARVQVARATAGPPGGGGRDVE